jgi:hypothetical protein
MDHRRFSFFVSRALRFHKKSTTTATKTLNLHYTLKPFYDHSLIPAYIFIAANFADQVNCESIKAYGG